MTGIEGAIDLLTVKIAELNAALRERNKIDKTQFEANIKFEEIREKRLFKKEVIYLTIIGLLAGIDTLWLTGVI